MPMACASAGSMPAVFEKLAERFGTDLPPHPIPATHAERLFGTDLRTLKNLIRRNELRAGVGVYRHNSGNARAQVPFWALLISYFDLWHYVRGTKCRTPHGFATLNSVASRYHIARNTAQLWLALAKHPALGRAIERVEHRCTVEETRTGRRHRLSSRVLVSISDFEICSRALKHPLEFRFPGNPGMWIAPGIFQDNAWRFFLTHGHIWSHRANFGLSSSTSTLQRHLARVESLELTYPGGNPSSSVRGFWRTIAYDRNSLAHVQKWYRGQTDAGYWMIPWQVWADQDGIWFSARRIIEMAAGIGVRIDRKEISCVREAGHLMRRMRVPPPPDDRRGFPNGLGFVGFVYHQDDVRTVLGVSPAAVESPAANGQAEAPAVSVTPAAQCMNDEKFTVAEKALLIVRRYRNEGKRITYRKLAEELDCSVGTLSKDKTLRDVMDSGMGDRRELPRGFRRKDGSYEAIDHRSHSEGEN